MRRIEITILIKLLSFLIILSFLFPSIKLFGFGMKLDLIFLYPLFLLVFIFDTYVKRTNLIKRMTLFSLLIFLSMVLSNTIGSFYYFHRLEISFPTEFLQISNRLMIFYCFLYIGYFEYISLNKFKIITSVIFIISLVFGMLQSISFSPAVGLSELYALTENQIKGFESLNTRVFGTSGNILTWAGLSGFFLLYFLIVLKNYRILQIVGIGLASLNLIYSSSRGAIVAFLVSIFFYFLLVSFYEKSKKVFFQRVFKVSLVLVALMAILFKYFSDRIEIMIFRFSNLNSEVTETGRATQLENVKSVFNLDYANYLFGLGKQKLDSIGLMEIEFFFILFCYGIVGVIITYWFLLSIVFEVKKYLGINSEFSIFIITSFVFYFIFSFGYFFIKEIYSGLIFWYIIGFFFGVIFKQYNEKQKNEYSKDI